MTVDTTGKPVAVTTGVTTDHRGWLVGVIAVGDGPSAVLDQPDDGSVHGQISLNAIHTLLDVQELAARADTERRWDPR